MGNVIYNFQLKKNNEYEDKSLPVRQALVVS